jgi:phage FluMu protein Com
MNVVVYCSQCSSEPTLESASQMLQPEKYNQPALLLASGQHLKWQCPMCGTEYEIEMEFEESGCEK